MTRHPSPVRGAGGGDDSPPPPSAPVESPDSLRSRQRARVIDLVSEGEIGGLVGGLKSVYLDDTPVQNADGSYNFTGITLVERKGTQAQSYIPGFPTSEAETAVATEVKYATPVVRSVSDGNINAVRVTLGIPALMSQNPTTGDISGTSVQIAIDVQTAGGGYVERIADIISGKSSSRYQRCYRVALTGPGPWDIRLRRLTADSVSAGLRNATWFDSITEIIDAKLRYPNSALVATELYADMFRVVPTRGFDIQGLLVQVPTNYDPLTRIYSGTWDGTFKRAWTDNPAWCYHDMVVESRYGCGDYIDAAQIDKWELYTIGQYCDGLVPDGFGGTEPRFRCNLFIQTREDAFKVLAALSSIFRAFAYWADGQVVVSQDAPADAVALFTAANVVDGTFDYPGSDKAVRHTVCLVAWNDPADRYRQKFEYVPDLDGIARWGVQQTEIVAVGCTSRGQAHRLGKWLLWTELNETETVSFRAGIDVLNGVAPGRVIAVADAFRAGRRLGGRIVAAAGASVTLDASVTIEVAKTYELSAVLPNGSVESRAVTSAPGVAATLALASAFTVDPLAGAIWVLAVSDLAPTAWRVISVAEVEPTVYEITALARNPAKFAAVEDDIKLDPVPTSAISAVPPPSPSDISFTESLYVAAPHVLGIKLAVSWSGTAARYAVNWRRGADNWQVETVTANSVDLINMAEGDHEFMIVAYDALGRRSPPQSATLYTVLGKSVPPADIGGLAAVLVIAGVRLDWAACADLDLLEYEVRAGSGWDSASVLATTGRMNQYLLPPLPIGTHTWLVKARDTTGNTSATAASVNLVVDYPAAPSPAATFAATDCVITWADCKTSNAIAEYEVRHGTSFAGGTRVGVATALQLKFAIDWTGPRTFWVAATDAAGNVGAAGAVAVDVLAPGGPTVSHTYSDANALLAWTAATGGSLPVAEYEIRHGGANWAGAVVVGRTKGTSWPVPVTWPGSRIFRVAAIDANGTPGGDLSTTVSPVAPSAVSPSAVLIGLKAALSWSVASGSLPVRGYEIRHGASWAAGAFVASVDGLAQRVPVEWTGNRTFWVAGFDSAGNFGTAASVVVGVTAPAAPVVSAAIVGSGVALTWPVPAASLPLAGYEVRHGASWAAGTSLGSILGTRFEVPAASWSGGRTFWVAASDQNGNVGAAGSVAVNVTAPSAPVLTGEVVDNNVLLRWTASSGTLPVATYELRRGATWAGAESVGTKSGGFTSVFETQAGSYTYWLAGIDTAGNTGTPASVTLAVSQPPDYVLNRNAVSTFSGTKSNMAANVDGSWAIPVNTTETWQTHFTARGWAGPSAQVAAGYDRFIQPSSASGYYEETIDHGGIIGATKITVEANLQNIVGTPAVSCTISKSTDGSAWTDYVGVWEVYVTSVRYVKVRITVSAAGATEIANLVSLSVRLDSKLKTVTGTVNCNAADSGGTTVYLTDDKTSGGDKLFLDVDAIQCTAAWQASYPGAVSLYDFTDTMNPLSFKVLLYDNAGTRISGWVSYMVRGF